MKNVKVPTTVILSIFTFGVISFGLVLGGFIFFKFNDYSSLVGGLAVVLLVIILAAVIRILGNINLALCDLRDLIGKIHGNIHQIDRDIHQVSYDTHQINCDTQDLNRNIHSLKLFFEQIERHLDIKK